MGLNQLFKVTLLCVLSVWLVGCVGNSRLKNEVRIVVGGDWDDHWGDGGVTQQSLAIGATHDLILLAGDLSYEGQDGDLEYNIRNARRWAEKANAIAGQTPMLFVAGDHDSRYQDGDISTYAKVLNHPDGTGGVTPAKAKVAGLDYEGQYPYLWYSDIVNGDVKVRVVGTSSAFQETEHEPAAVQKYLAQTYPKGSENYRWIESVYADARHRGYWILHLNHLPWVDMGKNQSFSDSQDLINLASKYGVSILMTGSSHNLWRTKPLKIDPDHCPSIALTTEAQGANPGCVGHHGNTHYAKSDGLIQTHVGVAGKTSAINLEKYPDACDPLADGEVKHYLAEGTCVTSAITGVVSLTITDKTLSGEFIRVDGSIFAPYSFVVERR